MDESLATFNGVDTATGGYLFPRARIPDLAREAAHRTESLLANPQARLMRRRAASAEDHLGVMYTVDPDDLTQAGWGLVHTPDTDTAVLEALRPLRELRRAQAGERYRELVCMPGEDAADFLWRHGMAISDPTDPRKVPYYLLLTGNASAIPFAFQHELDVQYAVGRLDFDAPDDYGGYADAVVAAESRRPSRRPLPIHLFGTRNPGDDATALSASRLLQPMCEEIGALAPDVVLTHDIGETATRARLAELLVDDTAAPVLLTATHGLGEVNGSVRATQGALVCQDWPGPYGPVGPIRPDHYLAAADVPRTRPLSPRIVFAFACYSAGTPDSAGGPYLARLPQRLLANTGDPVLAFIGHVDRAWGYSFMWKGAEPQFTAMLSTVLAISEGHRVGSAMEYLNARWAAITADLASRLDAKRRFGKLVDEPLLAWLWTASNDARNYIVIGDPATRAW